MGELQSGGGVGGLRSGVGMGGKRSGGGLRGHRSGGSNVDTSNAAQTVRRRLRVLVSTAVLAHLSPLCSS